MTHSKGLTQNEHRRTIALDLVFGATFLLSSLRRCLASDSLVQRRSFVLLAQRPRLSKSAVSDDSIRFKDSMQLSHNRMANRVSEFG